MYFVWFVGFFFDLTELPNVDIIVERDMKFGFHISISGGFSKVVERAKVRRCETLQLFSRNPRGWKCSPLNQKEVDTFKKDIELSGINPIFVHMPYLPNLASQKKELYKNSISSLCEGLKRTERLGAPFLIMHVGSRLDAPEPVALDSITKGINESFNRVKNKVVLLLENTAGMGSEVGSKFEQIKKIFEQADDKSRMGVCLDTAHAYEAGYDLANEDGLERMLDEFDKLIGLNKLHLLHLNDSKTTLNSHKDRHWHIGEGYIGIEGFRRIINHPLLVHLPGIMETPRKDTKEDERNMKVVRNLRKV